MKTNLEKSRVLVVEDEAIVAADIQGRLTSLGYNVTGTAGTGEEAIQKATEGKPDLVLMDIMLGDDADGVATADLIRKNHDIPVVFLTAHADEATLRRARISEPFGYIVKPFEEHTLHTTIQMALYRHQSEQKIRKLERWFSTTLRSIGDGVIAIDTEGRVTFMNMVAEGLTGWPLAQAVHHPCDEIFRLISERTRQPVENPAQAALREGLIIQLAPETLLITRQGNEVSIEDSAAPIRDETGGVTGAVVVFRDATERRKSELAVQHLNQSLENALSEASNQKKTSKKEMEFLAHAISHDLRSPLTALKLCSQMLGDSYAEALGKEGVELLEVIQKSLARMEEMIGGYLHFGHKEQLDATCASPVDMNRLVNQVINDQCKIIGKRQVEFTVDTLPLAKGNATLLRQVWTNLISNAVKYSENQAVVKIQITGREEASHAIYEVADNGLGFDPAQTEKLFGEYQRLHKDSGIKGTGLGLNVVKQIVERHGGRVWAAGYPGGGATFGFSLLLAPNPK